MVRYYGEFSNCVRGRRRKAHHVEAIPTVLEPEISSAQERKNWARLIQKVYEADPLVRSHRQGRLKVVSFIENGETIRKILEHLDLPACRQAGGSPMRDFNPGPILLIISISTMHTHNCLSTMRISHKFPHGTRFFDTALLTVS